MQAIFKDIVDGDEESVRARIEKDPSLVDAVASGAPKKYAGQSPLQVAIRTAQFGIAKLLLEKGSDPNFADVTSPKSIITAVARGS